MKNIIIHHNDFDGISSAAIVYQNLKSVFKGNIEFYETNYNREFDFSIVDQDDFVYIVDFSFPIGEMKLLKKSCSNLIWIDHHKTAIEEAEKYGFRTSGIIEIGYAGVELTWLYFNNIEILLTNDKKAILNSIPINVKLVGRYDVWDKDFSKSRFTDPWTFQYGLRALSKEYDLRNPTSEIWNELLNEKNHITDLRQRIFTSGEGVLAYKKQEYNIGLSSSFEVDFEGLKVITINNVLHGSMQLEKIEDNYDATVVFHRKKDIWLFSMYSSKDNIDVGSIAKKYGGGGHKGAAGFSCPLDDIPKGLEIFFT